MVARRDDNGRMHGRMHEYRDTKRTLNRLTDLLLSFPPCLEKAERATRRFVAGRVKDERVVFRSRPVDVRGEVKRESKA